MREYGGDGDPLSRITACVSSDEMLLPKKVEEYLRNHIVPLLGRMTVLGLEGASLQSAVRKAHPDVVGLSPVTATLPDALDPLEDP